MGCLVARLGRGGILINPLADGDADGFRRIDLPFDGLLLKSPVKVRREPESGGNGSFLRHKDYLSTISSITT